MDGKGKYRSSVDAREPQNPTKSEEYQRISKACCTVHGKGADMDGKGVGIDGKGVGMDGKGVSMDGKGVGMD
eukprot:3673826-Pyramimonas_sp.AAC.1